jgi:hypothetical protein
MQPEAVHLSHRIDLLLGIFIMETKIPPARTQREATMTFFFSSS